VFDDCAEDCLQFIEQTTWTELKKLWIILIQLWRKAFTRPGLETMDSRVKVLRNYMPKPFMRFYGSPAMCLIRDTHASEIPQWRSKTNKGVESGTNPMRRGGTMKNSEEKEHVMCTWGDRINERALFKEGFLRKKFLTRGGYAKRYVRIVLVMQYKTFLEDRLTTEFEFRRKMWRKVHRPCRELCSATTIPAMMKMLALKRT